MSTKDTRIELHDTIQDMVIKMSEGNPGALRVCMDVIQKGKLIDSDSALGGLGVLLQLDSYGIYGHRIWMLYKDVCEENLVMMVSILRAAQFGFVNKDCLNHAIDNYGDGVDVDVLYGQVKERLPKFASAIEPPVVVIHEVEESEATFQRSNE